MTKQDVLDLIADNLSTGSNITAAEHRAVEEAIVNYVGPPIVAYGRVGPIDIAFTQTTFQVFGGNLLSAFKSGGTGDNTIIRVTFPNDVLIDNNFKVRFDIESNGDINPDNNLHPIVFKKVSGSTDRFDFLLEEFEPSTQSIYVHVEVVQL